MKEIVKLLGVAWVGAFTFVFAFFISSVLDKLTPRLDPRRSRFRLILEISTQFAVIGVITYGSRVLIKNIPFPLDGLNGYDHSTLGELRSLPLFVFIFMFFQSRTQEKMKHLIRST
jgi:hypothetical protein